MVLPSPLPRGPSKPLMYPGRSRYRILDTGNHRSPLADDPVSSSALDDVDGQAASGGLLVLVEHVSAGVAHGLDGSVEADEVFAVASHGEAGGADGLDGGDC